MSDIVRFTTEVQAVITGTGSGATANVEAEVTIPSYAGRVVGYRMRTSAGSGTPAWNIHQRTGQAFDATQHRVSPTGANLTTTDATNVRLTPDTYYAYHNQDTTDRLTKLYVVFENDRDAADDSTWHIVLELLPDFSPGAKQ